MVNALGHSLLASGKYEAAVINLQRGTQLDPRNPDAWYDLGKAQALVGRRNAGWSLPCTELSNWTRRIRARTINSRVSSKN